MKNLNLWFVYVVVSLNLWALITWQSWQLLVAWVCTSAVLCLRWYLPDSQTKADRDIDAKLEDISKQAANAQASAAALNLKLGFRTQRDKSVNG